MDKTVHTKTYIIVCFFYLFSLGMSAQTPVESLFTDNYTIGAKYDGTLGLCIDNINFLHNIETDGDILKGYTLPGFRIRPRLVYYPTSIIKMEAGLSLLKFWGAEKYPNYAYQDISEWKADTYQYAFHILPFFRVQIQPVPQLNIVLGNIYGGENHRLIAPLYNYELNMTADPETGAQIIYNSRYAHIDAWVNWETFTFKNEMSNEVVDFGVSSCFHITDPKSFFYAGIPVQALMIHRGGEIDGIGNEVFTFSNGSTGLRLGMNFDRSLFKYLGLDMMGAASKKLYSDDPVFFNQGWAFYSALYARIWNLNLKTAFWRSGDFINLFGNPVFGNISQTLPGRYFPRTMVFNPGIKFEQKFGDGYYLGVNAECFYNPKLIGYEEIIPVQTNLSFSWITGLYIRINPEIIFRK